VGASLAEKKQPKSDSRGARRLLKAIEDRFIQATKKGPTPAWQLRPLFDGSAADQGKTNAVSRRRTPKLPSFVLVGDAQQRDALARIWAEARRSRTGRRILDQVEAMHKRRKRKLVFDFRPMRNEHAYVDWSNHLVRMSDSHMKGNVKIAAPILVHELTHVLQKGDRLPYFAIELELEAWLITLKVADELGTRFPSNDFQSSVRRKFRSSLANWIDFLHEQHNKSDNFSFITQDRDQYIAFMKKKLGTSRRRVSVYKRTLAKRKATYKQMKAANYPADALRNFREDEIRFYTSQVRDEEGTVKNLERDLRIVESHAGWGRYREYATRVLRALRDYHKKKNGW